MSKAVQLFVRNVGWTTTKSDLRNYFNQYGKVFSCRVDYNLQTGYPKNIALVRMNVNESEEHLLKTTKHQTDGRTLIINIHDLSVETNVPNTTHQPPQL